MSLKNFLKIALIAGVLHFNSPLTQSETGDSRYQWLASQYQRKATDSTTKNLSVLLHVFDTAAFPEILEGKSTKRSVSTNLFHKYLEEEEEELDSTYFIQSYDYSWDENAETLCTQTKTHDIEVKNIPINNEGWIDKMTHGALSEPAIADPKVILGHYNKVLRSSKTIAKKAKDSSTDLEFVLINPNRLDFRQVKLNATKYSRN